MKHFLYKLIEHLLADTNAQLFNYQHASRVISRIRQIAKDTNMLLGKGEAYLLYKLVKNTAKLPGHIAEVGVYRGGSARLIAENKGDKELHLFDTFEDGLPEPVALDSVKFWRGQFATPLETVTNYLSGIDGVYFHKGCFPDTAAPIADMQFSFVHLDVDIYQSTKDALEFFYPRMVKGGVIVSHDYRSSAGVTKAFDDFFADKPEPLIEMPSIQVVVTKT